MSRAGTTEEFFDGFVHIAGVSRSVNFFPQASSGNSIEIAIRRIFKNGCHVGGDGIRPSVAVIAGVVAGEVAEAGNEGSSFGSGQKDFGEDALGNLESVGNRFGIEGGMKLEV